MKEKEDELNSIIIELRKNLETLQEKHAKEVSDKMVRSTLEFVLWLWLLKF